MWPVTPCVPYHFVQKGKILKRSACESKTIKGSIHVFTQEGNQCGLSILAFLILTADFKRVFTCQRTGAAHKSTKRLVSSSN